MRILEEMKARRLFCDGGMGSLLQARGLMPGELPELWNLTHRDVLKDIHRAYLEAGADIMTTNTFGANRLKFKDNLEEIVAAAVENARAAVEEAGHGYVALDLGPTGRLLKPLGDLEFEDAVGLYREVVAAGALAGADLVLIETMSDSYELKAAVLAAREAGLRPDTGERLPIFATVIFDEKGKLLTGGNVESTVALLEGLRVDALGINCGLGPIQMKGILKDILRVSSLPVLVNPNAGLPRSENGKTVYDIDAAGFAVVMEEIVSMGAVIVGGCCGTTPEHIGRMVERCRDIPVVWPEPKGRTVVSSYARAVSMGGKTVIIGERINPTGKSKFKQALRDHNLEYILREGVSQQDNGADVLDVNVGLPEIDEPAMMVEAVRELQAIIDLPLQIDTSDMEAMERAMRIYNGKPLINSVNGKEESMSRIFPLVARYGGVVVGLCLDEAGIPETAQGRLDVGKKIIERAARYGIGPEDIILDGLCMTVSSDSRGALTTLDTLRRIRDELGVATVLGVSNISFGLPQREIINGAFFTMAMECGLGAAIINPNSEAMMRAYYSFNALMDRDPQCSRYISVYSGQTAGLGQTIGGGRESSQTGGGRGGAAVGAAPGSVSGSALETASGPGAGSASGSAPGPALAASIERGLKDGAHQAVTELLKEHGPLDIIDSEIIPALDRVGKGFEKGTVFLPQLLMSAEAAKAAFEVIKGAMESSGQVQEKKGTIILATVKGDIHDIGKNIVKVLLENYSYEVIDLGRDVPPEAIVREALERDVALVGLSALMTTTVPSMEETIRQLRAVSSTVKVMVGGAVLTEEYAATIGADAYCRDAMASVNYAEQVFGS